MQYNGNDSKGKIFLIEKSRHLLNDTVVCLNDSGLSFTKHA